MGWFWNKTPPSDSSNDPLRNLDPSLQEFLAKESPVKYKPAPSPAPSPPESTPQTTATTSTLSPHEISSTERPLVPPQSLYPDGRYAHLWRNYRPLSQIEDENKSDQEKLYDVLQGYKARRARIGRAAVENCVFEQLELDDCWSSGNVTSTLTMCRKQSRAFERCYLMQGRFLRALGYLSAYGCPPEVDEQIQMHADTLYHRMIAQEKGIEAAKAAGQPEPTFAPILDLDAPPTPDTLSQPPAATTAPTKTSTPSPTTTAATTASNTPQEGALPTLSRTTQSLLNASAQKKLREKMKTMSPYEREAEERSTQMDLRLVVEIASQMKEVEVRRAKRREEGNATASDTIAGWFGR